MLAQEFMRNALIAGSAVGIACGVVGWFVVARAQLFAGDALSHVAFVGAIAAAVVGVDERVGLFAVTLAVAAGLAAAYFSPWPVGFYTTTFAFAVYVIARLIGSRR